MRLCVACTVVGLIDKQQSVLGTVCRGFLEEPLPLLSSYHRKPISPLIAPDSPMVTSGYLRRLIPSILHNCFSV